MKHEISKGDRRTDVVNLIGGIANVLVGIIYLNDNQIKEVHFKQVESKWNHYIVKIRRL